MTKNPANLFLFPDLETAPDFTETQGNSVPHSWTASPSMSGSATTNEPADAPERARALDTTRSFLVEAPAGSGKTGLLIQRFLKLLAGPDVTDPAQVLAITFTRKAAGELRERVLTQLLSAAAASSDTHPNSVPHSRTASTSMSGTPPPLSQFDTLTRTLALTVLTRDAALNWNLLAQPARLNISTIDSVCARIAHSLPVLAGAAASLSPTEWAAPLHAEAARRTLLRLGGPDAELSQAIELLLLHRDGSLADLEAHIAAMLATREQWGELIPVSLGPNGQPLPLDDARLEAEVLPRLERALDRAICRTLTQATRILPPAILESLATLAADMAHADGHQGNVSPLAFCAGLRQPPAEIAAHLDHWRALVNLLLKKDGDWRKRLSIADVKFAISKEHVPELKLIIDQLKAHDEGSDQLRSALCAIQALPSAEYPPEQWILAKALFRILGQALADLSAIFSTHAACDFTEPAQVARTALRAPLADDSLEAATGTRLRHLLVDEMQDTSSGQYELIELLTRTWSGAGGQTVFLVGDPKQSIYLFRQARVERFVRTLTTGRLGGSNALALETLRLTANFRSTPALVESFNDDFRLIFPTTTDAAHPEDVPFYPAIASHASTQSVPQPGTASPSMTGSPPQQPLQPKLHSWTASPSMSGTSPQHPSRLWHGTILPYVRDTETRQHRRQSQRELDAAAIAIIVRDWQSRPLPPGRTKPWRLAVLVRGRNLVYPVMDALRTAAIPYKAIDIDALAERQEVLDLIALTRALMHPADRTAWLALLRAPWCGLKLADLHQIAGADQEPWRERTIPDAMDALAGQLSPDGLARLLPFRETMRHAAAQNGTMSLSAWVEHTWRALNAHAAATPEELANADRFFTLLDEFDPGTAGAFDLTALDERLKRLYAAPSLVPGAVEITTIHNAKGLEWDVVFVPALDHASPATRGRLLDWLELDPDGDPLSGEPLSLLAPIQGKGRDAFRLNAWMRGLLSAREAAERKRLFYVVSTRAREELHLFASPFAKSKGGPAVPPMSLLKAAWPAAEPHFPQAATPGLAEVIEMPTIVSAPLSLAAAAETPPPVLIERIPQPAVLETPPKVFALSEPHRPEGSFATRILGNTLHTLLDHVATRLAAGATARGLQNELKTWSPRIRNLLLANGLGAADLPAATQSALRGLENTLNDQEAQWLFAPQLQAASEYATTSMDAEGNITSVRIDRTFLAGASPRAAGTDHLWIIDIKTGTHGASGLKAWLDTQKEVYRPQLERYAAALAEPAQPVRVALYFPMLPRLIWWPLDA